MKTTTAIAVGALALPVLPCSVFAEAPAYKADKSFGNEDIKSEPVCVAMDATDRLFLLQRDGSVLIYDTEGVKTGGFKAEMKPAPTTMTVADGKVYLLNTKRKEKEMTFQGRKVKRLVADGVGCEVFDAAGAKVASISLPEATDATDVHFVGKELAVGNFAKGQIVFYEITGTEAKVTRKIEKVFRLCCGIFDFCPGSEPGSLVAANLGAFKVQAFKDGAKTSEFGARGDKPEEFRGCCNPVNVGLLPDGSIVTVEKDPTRVKIFDKENKTCAKITGLTELVQGCSTIPIAIDSKGMIYLASASKKCVIKCAPGVSDKPEPPEPKEEAMEIPELSPAMKEMEEKVEPLMEAKEYAKAKEAAEAIMKAHPDMDVNEKAQVALGIGLAPHMEKGDAEAAVKEVDAVVKAYPNSMLAQVAEQIKASIKQAIEAKKEDGGEAEEAPEAPETPEADTK